MKSRLYVDAKNPGRKNTVSKTHRPVGDIGRGEAGFFSSMYSAISKDYYLESIGFHLFPWQRAVLRDQATRITICGARQYGKSTILSGVCCHTAKYKPGSLSVILAPTKLQASEDIGKVRDFMTRDPDYPTVRRSGAEEIVLENRSRILVLTATDTAARGFSKPAVVLFDEASRIDDSVYDAVRPMITGSRTSVIYEISTPFGKKGFFYDHFSRVGSQERKIKRSRYLVKAPWQVVRTSGKPVLARIPLDEIEGVHCFFSPRHEDGIRYSGRISLMRSSTSTRAQGYPTRWISSRKESPPHSASALLEASYESQVPDIHGPGEEAGSGGGTAV